MCENNNLHSAEETAKSLILKHGLYDYTFEWDNALKRFGLCNYRRRVISLSKVLTPHRTDDEIKNTILHEIAHALACNQGYRGHGYKWRMIFISIGGNGQRCSDDIEDRDKISRYIGRCPNGHISYKSRLPKNKHSCGRCSRVFNEAYIIKYERNVA